MAAIKDQLIEHIDAYAAAKATGNAILSSLSAAALKGLLDSLVISEAPPVGDGFEVPEEPASRSRNRRAS